MYAYLFPFQSDGDIILLPYKKNVTLTKKIKKEISINGKNIKKCRKWM